MKQFKFYELDTEHDLAKYYPINDGPNQLVFYKLAGCIILSARYIIMLQAGVAVNAADFKGLTPLMTACMFGRIATAAFLLGMGALNHLTDINGDTALHWAAYKGRTKFSICYSLGCFKVSLFSHF